MDTFTIGLAKEVAAKGIRVNAVRPGFIDTDMQRDTGDPARLEKVRAVIPLQRTGTAEEIAGGILWLLSDEAAYMTGSFLDMAGGR